MQAAHTNAQTGALAFMMITSSGGRVEMRRQGTTNVYESADNSYVQLIDDGAGGALVRTTDGTQYSFVRTQGGHTFPHGEYRCVQIKDRNGNLITATYDGYGHPTSIVDTLGRTVYFQYDAQSNLERVWQWRWVGGVWVQHTWAWFYPGAVTMNTNFTVPKVDNWPANGTPVQGLVWVTLADGSYYRFEHTAWGQVWQITHHAPDQHVLTRTRYNLPGSELFPSPPAQSDCPRFSERRDWVEYGVMGEHRDVTTSYGVDPSGTWGAMTMPDGTYHKETFSTEATWRKGLIVGTEMWTADPATTSGAIKKKWTTTAWTQTDETLPYQNNPRPTETIMHDGETGRQRRTTIEYSDYSLPQNVREWGGQNGTQLLRRSETHYRWDGDFTSRRIIGLPSQRALYEGESALQSKTDYHYDWSDGYYFQQGPIAQHDTANYSISAWRGNLTGVLRYDTTQPGSAGAIWVQAIGYNTAGSVLFTQDAAGHRTTISYADRFADQHPHGHGTLAYPSAVTDPDGHTAYTTYNWDHGRLTKTSDPKGAEALTEYDPALRLLKVTNLVNGAYTRYVYPTYWRDTIAYSTVMAGYGETRVLHSTDGAGRLMSTAHDLPGSSGGFRGTAVHRDVMGRVARQYNPTEMDANWTPAGDDAPAGWRYTLQAYDWQGRPTVTTNQDGTTRSVEYTGCGCAGGEVATTRDERGRQRKLYKDDLGRLAKVEEYNLSGGFLGAADYTYNGRDQLTGIGHQWQARTFQYDGHGRLWKRTTPEQGTMEYGYNSDDTVQWLQDARGARTTYTYNNRHLPTTISYSAPGGSGVAATPTVTFGYDAAGNREWMDDGPGRVDYHYDQQSRLEWERRTFDGEGLGTYQLSYSYNLAGQLTVIDLPWGSRVYYGRDQAGQVRKVQSEIEGGATYADQILYRATGAVKGMTYGNGKQLSTGYDTRLRMTSWQVGGVLGSEYSYHHEGEQSGRVTFAKNVASETAGGGRDPRLDRSYQYDSLGRLWAAHTGREARITIGEAVAPEEAYGPYSYNYHYDMRGNLTQRVGWGGASQVTFAYDGGNRQQVAGFSYYSYDSSGNVTADGTQSYAYDVQGQQTWAAMHGRQLTQGFDGDGQRVTKNDGGQQWYYLRSSVLGGAVVGELNGTAPWRGQWHRGYLYLGAQQLAQQVDGTTVFAHSDPVTKSQRLTDMSGAVVSRAEMDPWGAETTWGWDAARQPHLYTSYEREWNGSDYAGARQYHSWYGRFDQPDPYDGSYDLSDPQSFNRYSYTQNDPVNHTDPTGLLMSAGGCSAEYSYSQCGGDAGFWGGGGGGGGGGWGDWHARYGGMSPAELDYEGRLQRTYEALDLNRALQQAVANNNSQAITAILARVQASSHLALVFQPNINLAANATPLQTVQAYLDAYRVTQYIRPGSLQVSGNGFAFRWTDQRQAERFLSDNLLFKTGGFGFFHVNDVGYPFLDARSLTSSYSPRSLQVTSGPRGGFADTDKHNPYQDVVGFVRHGVQEVLWNYIRRPFR